MGGRKLVLEWRDDEGVLLGQYRAEASGQLKQRLHALWLLRQGKGMDEVAHLLGVHYRTVP